MKKSILAICFVALVTSGYPSQDQAPKTNFRKAAWGMTKEVVIKIEGQEPQQKMRADTGLEIIAYTGKAGSLSCFYGYFFADNKLVQGRYIFTDKHSNKNEYINDFRSVRDSLTEKYGKPSNDQTYWKNDLYKNDPADWGTAVSVGHLAFEVGWTLDDTEIRLQLTGDNFDLSHMLQYSSTLKEHLDLVKKAAAEAKKGIW